MIWLIAYLVVAYLVIGACWAGYDGWMQFKLGFVSQVDKEFCWCVLGNLTLWPVVMFFVWLCKADDLEQDL